MAQVENMINAASELGYSIHVHYEGEIDYSGYDAAAAIAAIRACDEIEVNIVDPYGVKIGWAYIVNGLDDDEEIADCSGWVSDYAFGWYKEE